MEKKMETGIAYTTKNHLNEFYEIRWSSLSCYERLPV